MRQLGALVAVTALLVAMAAAAPAGAAVKATVQVTETGFDVRGGPERADDPLEVTADQLEDGRVRYSARIPSESDSRRDTLEAGPGCTKPLPTELVECVVPAALNVTVALGDGRDSTFQFVGDTVGSSITVDLGPGNDIQLPSGWDGPVTIDGGAGDDQLAGSGGDEVLRGGDGDDQLGIFTSDRIRRGSDNSGNDVLDGGAGDDVLNPHGGRGAELDPDARDADSLDGGPGVDLVDLGAYREETTLLVVDLAAGTISGGRDTGNTIRNVENVDGGGRTQLIRGDDRPNRIEGPRAEQVFGGGGNDVIEARRGSVDAGSGNDTLVVSLFFSFPSTPMALNGAAGSDTVEARGSEGAIINLGSRFVDTVQSGFTRRYATLANIENANGTSGRDTITGNSGRNVIRGGNGIDTINPGRGRDTVLSGAGRDVVRLVDRTVDSLNCGAGGRDDIRADRIDRLGVSCRPRGGRGR